MKRGTWVLSGAVVAGLAASAGVVVASGASEAAPVTPRAHTVEVKLGALSALVSLDGILTYRARADGSPYTVVNQARGTYTKLPDPGDKAGCGDVLYRVDDDPVLLLCGPVPAYRDLHRGQAGRDVRELNRNLHTAGGRFTWKTENSLEQLQRKRGSAVTGELRFGAAVFTPRPVRVAKVSGEPGGPARRGAPVLSATSDTPEVQVNLEASQQGEVKPGDRAQITLPGNRVLRGRVKRLGSVASAQQGDAADATIPAYVGFDEPRQARGLDRAPVRVDITTKGVERALSVPVTALVGTSGGGFAVEVVRAGGRRALVAVRLGLFDDTDGRVAVAGALRAGDAVVVPSL